MKTWIPESPNFAYLNWRQVDALPRESTLLVLPTAAIEQHGPHLPLATDTLINNLTVGESPRKTSGGIAGVRAAARALRKKQRAYRLPGDALGERVHIHGRAARPRSDRVEHRIQKARALQHARWKGVADRRDGARPSGGIAFEGLGEQERASHAGEVENSFLLASVPELVDGSAYTSQYIASIEEPALLRPENAPAVFAWLTRDISQSGVLGDPRPATAEKGARWIEEAAAQLAKLLEAMFRYPDKPPK